MPVTVSPKNYSPINNCEAASDWTGSTPGDVSDFYKEGTQCVGFEMRSSGNNDSYIIGSWDLSGVKHLRAWFMTNVLKELNTEALGGIQLFVSDGTNTGYYYVGGGDTYPGGWLNLVIDLSRNVDSGTKPTMTAITSIGLRMNLTATAKKVQNTWLDHLCICDGLIVYGDDAGGYFDFADILSADENTTNGWGIIRKISGQYFLVGSIEFGDSGGSSGTKFQDKSQVGVFENRKVNSSLYNFTVVDNGTGTTEFILGSKAGTAGVEGCMIRVQDTAQTPKFYIDAGTDTDVDNFKLYGSTFFDASTLKFPNYATNVEVLNCNFESCDELLPTTATIKDCNFVSANDEAFILPPGDTHNLEYCNFINCPNAWRIPNSGTYSCVGCKFINNTIDVDNTSGGLVTVNTDMTTTTDPPTTYTGSTTLNNTVSLKITCKNEAGNAIEGVKVRVETDPGGTLITEGNTNSSGIYSDYYNYTSDQDIRAIARLKGYKFNTILDMITSNGLNIPFTMINDKAVDLP